MSTDRGFTHPNFGTQARVVVISRRFGRPIFVVEQHGNEVRVIFVAGTRAQATSLCDSILEQMKAGALNITLMGKPTSVEEI